MNIGEIITQKGLVHYNIASSKEGEEAEQRVNHHHQQYNYEMTFLSLLLFESNMEQQRRLLDCIKERKETSSVVCDHTTTVSSFVSVRAIQLKYVHTPSLNWIRSVPRSPKSI